MLENFKKVGIKVILDVHSAQTDNQGHNYPLWYTGTIMKRHLKSMGMGGQQYKNDDTIIGFDLKNEPHTNSGTLKIKSQSAIWDDSDHKNNWKRVAQETALEILAVHPNALIFVEGVEIYPKDHLWNDESVDTSPWTGTNDYYGNWWGGNLRGVKDYPIDLGKYQKQLVYSPHDYGPWYMSKPGFRAILLLQTIKKQAKYYMTNAGRKIGRISWKREYPRCSLVNGEVKQKAKTNFLTSI
jgi:aryl-phospho-beta-D-glucosidase BglC (GH1 family)